jgi:hypothetical protein
MRMAGKAETSKAETFASLSQRAEETRSELLLKERELEMIVQQNKLAKKAQSEEGEEDLDDYMKRLKSGGGAGDKEAERKLKANVAELRKELARLERLRDIAKPAQLPTLSNVKASAEGRKVSTVLGRQTRWRRL